MKAEFFLGRQPIYDRSMDVCAYELLYRRNNANSADVIDGSLATTQVVYDAFIEIGLDHLVGPHLAFINMTTELICGEHTLPFSTEQVVLEVLEDVPVDDPDVLRCLRSLSNHGYTIALDDFIYREAADSLISIADIIKLDVLSMDRTDIAAHVRQLKSRNVRLLAEKVETKEDFKYCHDLGFDYFQGYFLSKPEVLQGRRVPTNQLGLMQLFALLQDHNLDVDKLEKVILNDVTLSYKLLRYINSAYFSLPRKIESIRQAVVYIGFRALKKWATLMGLLKSNDRPSELLVTAMARARMCELLGAALGRSDTDTYFTVGLFSTLEALLEAPLEEILKSLPLSTELYQALVAQEGEAGKALGCTLAYERGDWDHASLAGLTPSQITRSYLDSIAWADEMITEYTG